MQIEEAIVQQKGFTSEYEKMVVNLLYTSSWLQINQVRFFKQFDISPEQYNVLRILRGQHPKSASVCLIQERMLDKMSNASRLVEKLKQKELVCRKECPLDRRQVDVSITEKGLKLLDEIEEKSERLSDFTKALNKNEALTLNTLLDKLRTSNN